jgi:suppressor of fused-like protein
LKRISSCRWVELTNDQNATNYREKKENSDDDDDEEDVKPIVKTERLSPCEHQEVNHVDETSIRILSGLHLTFNLEAGSLLPLAIKLVTLKD